MGILSKLPLRKWTYYGSKSIFYKSLEKQVPNYTLPDLLITKEGKIVETAEMWKNQRRTQILELFKEHVYGYSPSPPKKLFFELKETSNNALNGKAYRKQIILSLTGKKTGPFINVLIYLPKISKENNQKIPAFVGLNFYGNHTIQHDENIILHKSYVNNNPNFNIFNNKVDEASRGVRASRWPAEYIVEQGFGIATAYYGEITPDNPKVSNTGIQSYFEEKDISCPPKSKWGAISTWAYGLSRIMDYFYQDDDIDENKVCVMGHSRLGKTALWTGAQDLRFAAVFSNCSGCGGAAISRRHFGETVQLINNGFPHWFCEKFKEYNEQEDQLPIDQHMLMALIAPRPLYVSSATHDLWADPYGEFLSAKHASPVFELLGTDGIGRIEKPKIEDPTYKTIGHHIRKGRHDCTLYDWKNFIAFVKKNNY